MASNPRQGNSRKALLASTHFLPKENAEREVTDQPGTSLAHPLVGLFVGACQFVSWAFDFAAHQALLIGQETLVLHPPQQIYRSVARAFLNPLMFNCPVALCCFVPH